MTAQTAIDANERGNAAKEELRFDEAEAAYRQAIAIDPAFSFPWFNLRVLFKWQARWSEARDCIEQALELDPRSPEGSLWNLGIVATAQGDWYVAREAWRAYGVEIPEGEGPIEMRLGPTPIRLNVTNKEVVWCDRIDPARALVRSVPMPDSGRRFGDLLLHDGAPAGYRMLKGVEVAVFDELALLAPSSYHTHTVTIHAPSADDVAELGETLLAKDMHAEDWTGSVNIMCRACSEGRPHAAHADKAPQEWRPERHIGIAAADLRQLSPVLEQWGRIGSGRRFQDLTRALEGAASA